MIYIQVKHIKVVIDQESGCITVHNDGDGIDIVRHPDHDIWVPEMIFGHVLTSTNYDADEEKTVAGQNGVGAKATNVMSKSFTIAVTDHRAGEYGC